MRRKYALNVERQWSITQPIFAVQALHIIGKLKNILIMKGME